LEGEAPGVKAVVGGSSGGSAAVGVGPEVEGGSTGMGGGFVGGNTGAGNKCEQSGHFIVCPAYWSGTVIIFWQLGQSTFMGDNPQNRENTHPSLPPPQVAAKT
jgi:hypothetical protein